MGLRKVLDNSTKRGKTMNKSIKYTKTEYVPYYMGNPMEPCDGYTDGKLTIYKIGKGWRIGHNTSNINLFYDVFTSLKEAKKVIKEIYSDWPQIDFKRDNPLDGLDRTQAMALKAYAQIGKRV